MILKTHEILALLLCAVQVSDHALTTFAAHEGGSTVAIGTSDGAVSVLQLSSGLAEMALNEKAAINTMFERETQREKNLEKAIKEAKVKARKEAARKDDVVDNITEEQLRELEDEFFKATNPEDGPAAQPPAPATEASGAAPTS